MRGNIEKKFPQKSITYVILGPQGRLMAIPEVDYAAIQQRFLLMNERYIRDMGDLVEVNRPDNPLFDVPRYEDPRGEVFAPDDDFPEDPGTTPLPDPTLGEFYRNPIGNTTFGELMADLAEGANRSYGTALALIQAQQNSALAYQATVTQKTHDALNAFVVKHTAQAAVQASLARATGDLINQTVAWIAYNAQIALLAAFFAIRKAVEIQLAHEAAPIKTADDLLIPTAVVATFVAVGEVKPMLGTLTTLGLSAIKWADLWAADVAAITGRALPALIILEELNLLAGRLGVLAGADTILTPETALPKEDGFFDTVPPVTINSTIGAINVRDTKRGQVITLDTTRIRKANPAIPLEYTLLGGVRPYPGAATQAGALTGTRLDVSLDFGKIRFPEIRPIALILTPFRNGTLTLSRSEVISQTTFFPENRLMQDKKSKGQMQYLAMLHVANKTWGPVSEILDALYALLVNTRVRIGGFWWTLASIPAELRPGIIAGMANGKFNHTVDWQGFGRTLLYQEYQDRAIAARSKAESAITMPLTANTMGLASTAVSRLTGE